MMQRKRVRVTSGEELIIHNVRQFFEGEKFKQQSIMRNEVIRRTAKATGIGMTTVKSVKREFMTAGGIGACRTVKVPGQRIKSGCVDHLIGWLL